MPLIPHAGDVFEQCYALGAYAVYISGAGPTVMAIVDGGNTEFIQQVKAYLAEQGLNWAVQDLAIDNFGTQIM